MKVIWLTITRQWLTAACTGLVAVTAMAQTLEVIDLEHRSAPEVIPVLQPLVATGGALSGEGYKLFVRTTSANLVELRKAIAQIDREPQALTVSVRKTTRQHMERERLAAQATLSSRGLSAAATAATSNWHTQSEGIASVVVLDGNAAFIATETSTPIVTAVAGGGARRPWLAAQMHMRELTTGFLVTPRVAGERVILDISQQDERLGAGAVQSQSLDTRLSGPLGQWIEAGGSNTTARAHGQGSSSRQYSTQSDDIVIWVKVEAN